MKDFVEVESRDYWFKVVEMLQQNWALVDILPNGSCKIFFVGDTSGLFDEIEVESVNEAISSLKRNGFARYAEDSKAQDFICPPKPPFYRHAHPNGSIYSSGRFWQ